MIQYIERLIEEGEHQCQDFKFCITDSRKIAKTLSAFANTEGGRLLIGVKDNGNIAGIQSEEEFYMIQAAAEFYLRPKISFQSKVWRVREKDVLEVVITPSDKMPHYAKNENGKWIAYVRQKDKNYPANHILLKVWEQRLKPRGSMLKYSNTEKFLLSYLQKHHNISLPQFCKLSKISRFKAERILVKLICWEVIKQELNETTATYFLK